VIEKVNSERQLKEVLANRDQAVPLELLGKGWQASVKGKYFDGFIHESQTFPLLKVIFFTEEQLSFFSQNVKKDVVLHMDATGALRRKARFFVFDCRCFLICTRRAMYATLRTFDKLSHRRKPLNSYFFLENETFTF